MIFLIRGVKLEKLIFFNFKGNRYTEKSLYFPLKYCFVLELGNHFKVYPDRLPPTAYRLWYK